MFKKFECNECYKGPCYFEMQKTVTGKPVGCLLIASKMPQLKELPQEMQECLMKKEVKSVWLKI